MEKEEEEETKEEGKEESDNNATNLSKYNAKYLLPHYRNTDWTYSQKGAFHKCAFRHRYHLFVVLRREGAIRH